MLNTEQCRSRAEQFLARIAQQCGEDMVLLPAEFATAKTVVYTYQTADYVATGNLAHALAGNGPILVSKLNGMVELAGTSRPIDTYVRAFEARTEMPT